MKAYELTVQGEDRDVETFLSTLDYLMTIYWPEVEVHVATTFPRQLSKLDTYQQHHI